MSWFSYVMDVITQQRDVVSCGDWVVYAIGQILPFAVLPLVFFLRRWWRGD